MPLPAILIGAATWLPRIWTGAKAMMTSKAALIGTGVSVAAMATESSTDNNADLEDGGLFSDYVIDPIGKVWDRASKWQGTAERDQQQIQDEAELDKASMMANIELSKQAEAAQIELQQQAESLVMQNEGFWYKVANFFNEITMGTIPALNSFVEEKKNNLTSKDSWKIERNSVLEKPESASDANTPTQPAASLGVSPETSQDAFKDSTEVQNIRRMSSSVSGPALTQVTHKPMELNYTA
jgi:hypothetical protein